MSNILTEEFRKECIEWLAPLGYSIHATLNNGTGYIFTNFDDHFAPSIHCFFDQFDDKKAIVYDTTSYKLFLRLATGEIQFKHPDIRKYINVFKHYGRMARVNPPF